MIKLVQRGRAALRTARQDAKGGALHISVALMSRYADEWEKLVSEMHTETLQVIASALAGGAYVMDSFTADASFNEQLFQNLSDKFNVLFAGAALRMAPKQIMAVDEASVRDLNMSLKDVSKFVSIQASVMTGPLEHLLRSRIGDNVDLITRIPQEYLTKVKADVYASIAPGGAGLKDLIPVMEERYGEAKRWARQVAMDQTRKAYSDINVERCHTVGVTKAEWIHTMGSNKPRIYHMTRAPAGLNGLIFELKNPPVIDLKTGERGLPGHAYFCHCTMRPIVSFAEVA